MKKFKASEVLCSPPLVNKIFLRVLDGVKPKEEWDTKDNSNKECKMLKPYTILIFSVNNPDEFCYH